MRLPKALIILLVLIGVILFLLSVNTGPDPKLIGSTPTILELIPNVSLKNSKSQSLENAAITQTNLIDDYENSTVPPSSTSPTKEGTTDGLLISETPTLAFPEAEGFGQWSRGGRGGKVIEVTNLSDDGPGSLRAAVNLDEPRIVVFRISGTIELNSTLVIDEPYITIAGQTAPGGGITIKNNPSNDGPALSILTHDVIIRYIRSRPGPASQKSSNGDAIEILRNAYNIIIDHSSFSWAIDEVVSTWYNAQDITIQWSIISEGLNCSTHEKGCHSMGLLLGSAGSGNISIHHNLFVHNDQRNPFIKTSGVVDIVNNVIFDVGYTPMYIIDDFGNVPVNIIGNFYKKTSNVGSDFLVSADSESGYSLSIFVQGNITPSRPGDDMEEWEAVKPKAREWLAPSMHDVPSIATSSAFEAYDQVLADAGATIGLDSQGNKYWRRDPVDERVVNDVVKGISQFINDPSEVGGWPFLEEGKPYQDSDQDGMPDIWESRYLLDMNNPSDGYIDADGDGFTNLEEFLNGTNPHIK